MTYINENKIVGANVSENTDGTFSVLRQIGDTSYTITIIGDELIIEGTIVEVSIGGGGSSGGSGFGSSGFGSSGFGSSGFGSSGFGSSGFGFGGNGGFDGVGGSGYGGVATAGFGGNDYLQTLGLMCSTVGTYGERAFKSGSYTQTNGNKGNFHDRPFKRLSQNAKANYNYANNLSKLSKAGSIVAGGAIIYDVFDDGNIKSSTVVNTALLITSLVFPPSAIFILGYGVADYFFDFSGKIDNRFGEIKTGMYDD